MTADSGDQARSRGHNYTSYDSGMCQKYVRGPCWDVPSLYGSAIEAWNGARDKHPGDRTPPDGAPVYYSGGQYGHAVLFCGAGHTGIRSTDCQSTGKVSDTDLDWPVRAWGYKYLGWTGDINGVDLPLGDGGAPPEEDDDMPKYVSTNSTDLSMEGDGDWHALKWEEVWSDASNVINPGDFSFMLSDRKYTATLTAAVDLATGERISTRVVETEKGSGSAYDKVVESGRSLEHVRTAGITSIEDTRTGWVSKGRALRFQMLLPAGAKVDASAVVLFW